MLVYAAVSTSAHLRMQPQCASCMYKRAMHAAVRPCEVHLQKLPLVNSLRSVIYTAVLECSSAFQ
jgi:hypothetical protein